MVTMGWEVLGIVPVVCPDFKHVLSLKGDDATLSSTAGVDFRNCNYRTYMHYTDNDAVRH